MKCNTNTTQNQEALIEATAESFDKLIDYIASNIPIDIEIPVMFAVFGTSHKDALTGFISLYAHELMEKHIDLDDVIKELCSTCKIYIGTSAKDRYAVEQLIHNAITIRLLSLYLDYATVAQPMTQHMRAIAKKQPR